MVLLTDAMDVEIVETPTPEPLMKRKRSSSENRKKKVKKSDADIVSEFVFETEASVNLFESKISPKDYVTTVVSPLLTAGHEADLYRWLFHMQLLKRMGRCSHPECNHGPIMKLKMCSRRWKDKAIWEASHGECKHKISIRSKSFFAPLKCDIPQAVIIIKEWCSNTPLGEVCHKYDIPELVAKRIYQQCADVAESYVSNYSCDWLLGGAGSVVLLDLWPSGLLPVQEKELSPNKRRADKVRILWLADTNCLPVRYWAHVLPLVLPVNRALKGEAKKEDKRQRHKEFVSCVVQLAQKHIAPNSLVLVNDNALPEVCNVLAMNRSFEAVTPMDHVLNADSQGHQSTKSILDNIWRDAAVVCDDAISMSRVGASRIVSQFLWRQQFASTVPEAFMHLLSHIATLYKPPIEVPGETEVSVLNNVM